MGRSADEREVIESWLRRIEWDGIYAAQEAFRNATPGLKGRALSGPVSLEQIPALAERGRLRVQHFFAWLDARLADNEFVCGPHFSIADISGMVAVELSAWRNSRLPSISAIYRDGTKTSRRCRAPKPDFSWRCELRDAPRALDTGWGKRITATAIRRRR
jgi:glutathione S-transferase